MNTDPSMHVLIDGSVFELPGTGVARATLGLYQHVAVMTPGLRISVVHRKPLQTKLPSSWNILCESPDLSPAAWRKQMLPGLVDRLRPDFVHFPWNGNIPRLPRTSRAIMTLHDVLPLEIPGYFHSLADRLRYWFQRYRDVRRAALIITDSYYSRYRIQQTLRPPVDPVVIYLASLLPVQEREPESPRREPFYVYVGGYDPRKGLDYLLALYMKLRSDGRLSSRLVMTGTPRYHSDAFKQKMAEAVARGWVEERGYLDDQSLSACFAQARALIYPSRYEGFGFPPVEAMTQGCPVLTTPRTSLPEICGDAVLYADPDDDHEFTRQWLALENDSALRDDLARRGRIQAQRFSWEASARQFLEALQSLPHE